jgi:hypothetical protein
MLMTELSRTGYRVRPRDSAIPRRGYAISVATPSIAGLKPVGPSRRELLIEEICWRCCVWRHPFAPEEGW